MVERERGDSGRHRALQLDEARYRRLHERIDALTRRFEEYENADAEMRKQLVDIIKVSQHAVLGFKAVTWMGQVVKWCMGALASYAIWDHWFRGGR